MSDFVNIPRRRDQGDTAVLLLAAAAELGLPARSITTTSFDFVVPQKIADKAGFGKKAEPKKEEPEKKEPAKKSAGKKSSAKSKKNNRSVV